MTAWPWPDPPSVAVITQRRILEGEADVLMICHDLDGAWQFLTGSKLDAVEREARVVALREMLTKDDSLWDAATLPLGWRLHRDSREDPWVPWRPSEQDSARDVGAPRRGDAPRRTRKGHRRR